MSSLRDAFVAIAHTEYGEDGMRRYPTNDELVDMARSALERERVGVVLKIDEVRRIRRVVQDLGSLIVGVMPSTADRVMKAAKDGADLCEFLIKKEMGSK